MLLNFICKVLFLTIMPFLRILIKETSSWIASLYSSLFFVPTQIRCIYSCVKTKKQKQKKQKTKGFLRRSMWSLTLQLLWLSKYPKSLCRIFNINNDKCFFSKKTMTNALSQKTNDKCCCTTNLTFKSYSNKY